ncbi:hypothetical protein OF122_11235 [Pelagibacterium flavum]|uniref:Uncharacterized protein n=1 Tax=Pelagibacterium flavum TaxID=2984530 RepID=A0ABY6IME1_9HYPH|nr:hypothetical protein [Pelagibacterium sp. YIM 151497]UYQ70647.1 hypothetical protein OF122_11235 [Pelagibacterium sp. YIM 151497]
MPVWKAFAFWLCGVAMTFLIWVTGTFALSLVFGEPVQTFQMLWDGLLVQPLGDTIEAIFLQPSVAKAGVITALVLAIYSHTMARMAIYLSVP